MEGLGFSGAMGCQHQPLSENPSLHKVTLVMEGEEIGELSGKWWG